MYRLAITDKIIKTYINIINIIIYKINIIKINNTIIDINYYLKACKT